MSKSKESSTERFGSEVLDLIDASPPAPQEEDDAETADEDDGDGSCSDS